VIETLGQAGGLLEVKEGETQPAMELGARWIEAEGSFEIPDTAGLPERSGQGHAYFGGDEQGRRQEYRQQKQARLVARPKRELSVSGVEKGAHEAG
jgi:hypothetical protein